MGAENNIVAFIAICDLLFILLTHFISVVIKTDARGIIVNSVFLPLLLMHAMR
jgi:hypothetical protein